MNPLLFKGLLQCLCSSFYLYSIIVFCFACWTLIASLRGTFKRSWNLILLTSNILLKRNKEETASDSKRLIKWHCPAVFTAQILKLCNRARGSGSKTVRLPDGPYFKGFFLTLTNITALYSITDVPHFGHYSSIDDSPTSKCALFWKFWFDISHTFKEPVVCSQSNIILEWLSDKYKQACVPQPSRWCHHLMTFQDHLSAVLL